MVNLAYQRSGARKIIDTCLDLSSGQDLLIVFDESTIEVANLMLEAASALQVSPTAIYVPSYWQAQLGKRESLPLPMESAIRNTTGIVTCLTDAQDCLIFRKKVFKVGLDRWVKIGHMPGVTPNILEMANADYHEIESHCHLLALILLRGRHLKLGSKDSTGKQYWLDVDLGGWERSPVVSSGIIPIGSWGNIPPGETFIAPLEGTGHGLVVINGSIPGYALPQGAELLLEFKDGEMVRYDSLDPRCVEVLEGIESYAKKQKDPYWRNLAEIGIGTNRAIKDLIGIELVDEKKLGTAHIALGENYSFGGTISSDIHSDLVISDPTLIVDNHIIMDEGKLTAQLLKWQLNHNDLIANDPEILRNSLVQLSSVQTVVKNRALWRQWKNGRGEDGWIQVGQVSSAKRAAKIYQAIRNHEAHSTENGTTLASLAERVPDIGETEILQLISLLKEYELVLF